MRRAGGLPPRVRPPTDRTSRSGCAPKYRRAVERQTHAGHETAGGARPPPAPRFADGTDSGSSLQNFDIGQYGTVSPGTGKSHLAQAIGRAAIQQGYRVLYRETHTFLEELAEATLADTRKEYLAELARAHLLIIDDLGMRKLPHTAAEDLLELIMRRYERASTMLTSNRPVDEWGKLLGDTAAVTALLDRLLHHAHVLKCGPRSWRTRVRTTLPTEDAVK